MTARSVPQVAAWWVGAGGAPGRRTEWVAIAMAESSLEDAALSYTGAIGLWQIEFFNAPLGGGTVADLYDPAYNAKVAVIMSGGGTNCAAWDTCYRDIAATGRYSFLDFPERGSAAFNNLTAASAGLGTDGSGGAAGPPGPSLDAGAGRAMADVGALNTIAVPEVIRDLLLTAASANQIYQKGWRAWMPSGP